VSSRTARAIQRNPVLKPPPPPPKKKKQAYPNKSTNQDFRKKKFCMFLECYQNINNKLKFIKNK
jgi:hypothetical protein